MSTDTPRIELTVAAPVDAVWNALRDKEKIRHWHGWEYDGLDQEIDLIFFTAYTESSSDVSARTLEVQGGDLFELHPDAEGTQITLTRAPHGSDPEWDAYYDDVTEGWITFLHQLKFALERQPGAHRRTLLFTGHRDGTGPVSAELGLGAVAGQPAGTPFAARLAGEDVTGEVWFRSDNQLGVTVDAWGHDGLLIVADTAPGATKPKGATMAVLTTYGLDDARYGELKDRWTAWWTRRYPEPALDPSLG